MASANQPEPQPPINSKFQIPPPEPLNANGNGASPHAAQGAFCSRSNPGTPQPFDNMGLIPPPDMPLESDYLVDFDHEEHEREREILFQDLASDNEDFTRSHEDGWFYSDEG